ncbi:MAG: 30S ribosomal protein S20 [Fidelibacterota bacterium]
MDRHPQQIKRERQDKKRRLQNVAEMSKLRSAVSNMMKTSTLEDAQKLYNNAVSTIDKAVGKGLIKKNTAARRKSRISRHLKTLS